MTNILEISDEIELKKARDEANKVFQKQWIADHTYEVIADCVVCKSDEFWRNPRIHEHYVANVPKELNNARCSKLIIRAYHENKNRKDKK